MSGKPPVSAISWILLVIFILSAFAVSNAFTNSYSKYFHPLINILAFLSVMIFHSKWEKEFIFSATLIICIGYLFFFIGIKTGIPFGNLSFTSESLFQVKGIPVISCLVFLHLIYMSRQLAESMAKESFLVACISSALFMLLQYFSLNFDTGHSFILFNPASHYFYYLAGMSAIVFLIQFLFIRSVKLSKNKAVLPVYLMQLGFYLYCFILSGKLI